MSNKYRNTNLAIIGAYISEGIFSPRDADNSEHRRAILDTSPAGHIGVIAEACKYAEYALDLCDAAYAVVNDYPGVWEYEVVDCFGHWYGNRLIETDHMQPTPQQVRVHLLNATQAFFMQAEGVDSEKLGEAILAVPFEFAE